MGFETGLEKPGWHRLPESVPEEFWDALGSGLSPTAAATVAGVHGATGRRWASAAGYQTNSRHFGIRYSKAVRDAFWELLRSGSSLTEAAVAAGVSGHTGLRWVRQAGYVLRTPVAADSGLEMAPKGVLSFIE